MCVVSLHFELQWEVGKLDRQAHQNKITLHIRWSQNSESHQRHKGKEWCMHSLCDGVIIKDNGDCTWGSVVVVVSDAYIMKNVQSMHQVLCCNYYCLLNQNS